MMESDADLFLKINKSIDLFGRVYKEITANYVDEVDPERFMEAGIKGMLGTLDPYTVYIDKEDGDEVDLLTNGKYGGIGIPSACVTGQCGLSASWMVIRTAPGDPPGRCPP